MKKVFLMGVFTTKITPICLKNWVRMENFQCQWQDDIVYSMSIASWASFRILSFRYPNYTSIGATAPDKVGKQKILERVSTLADYIHQN